MTRDQAGRGASSWTVTGAALFGAGLALLCAPPHWSVWWWTLTALAGLAWGRAAWLDGWRSRDLALSDAPTLGGSGPLPSATALLPLGAGWEPDPNRPGWWIRERDRVVR